MSLDGKVIGTSLLCRVCMVFVGGLQAIRQYRKLKMESGFEKVITPDLRVRGSFLGATLRS